MSEPDKKPSDFDKLAAEPPPGLVRELMQFLGHNKKWWLLPVIIAMLLAAALVVLSTTSAGAFIYTLF
jgi:hypothetical protein